MADKFTSFGIVVDRKGREHKIYPALLKKKDELRHLTPKFDDNFILLNIMMPQRNDEGQIETDWDGQIEWSDEAYDAMMEVLMMAFDYKYTREQIEEFVDVAMIPKILDIFYDLSGYRKKLAEAQRKK